MTETMKWWITQADIDGFRVDVALMLPVDYCNELRMELDKVKPVFMLGESDHPEQQVGGFHMTYDWKLYQLMNHIASGKSNATSIMKHFDWVAKAYPYNSFLMNLLSIMMKIHRLDLNMSDWVTELQHFGCCSHRSGYTINLQWARICF